MITIRKRLRSYPSVDPKKMKTVVSKMLQAIDYDNYDVSIWLTNNPAIRTYNAKYRKKDKPTDILSFPYHTALIAGDRINVQEEEDKNLGDIMISLEYIAQMCRREKINFDQRLNVILAHGIAHLLNYDHQTDDEYEQMQKVEKKLLASIEAN